MGGGGAAEKQRDKSQVTSVGTGVRAAVGTGGIRERLLRRWELPTASLI